MARNAATIFVVGFVFYFMTISNCLALISCYECSDTGYGCTYTSEKCQPCSGGGKLPACSGAIACSKYSFKLGGKYEIYIFLCRNTLFWCIHLMPMVYGVLVCCYLCYEVSGTNNSTMAKFTRAFTSTLPAVFSDMTSPATSGDERRFQITRYWRK